MGRFETELVAIDDGLAALADLSGARIDRVHGRKPPKIVAIRLPANSVLQKRIGHLLKCPVGRPRVEVRRYYANFSYQAQSWKMPRRVVAKAEWHPPSGWTLAPPEEVARWSLTSLREKLVKIGAKIVTHARYVTFQMSEVAVPRGPFADILRQIAQLRPPPSTA